MIHWLKRTAASISNASAGKLRLFADSADNLFKTKDEAGVIRVLGDGISGIALQSTNGLAKTYRITRQSGVIFDLVVNDGRGIASVARTAGNGAPGTFDTYTITFNDNPTTTFSFQVYNGRDGLDGLVQSVNGKSQANIVLNAADVGAIPAADKGQPNGVASLDGGGKVPAAQLPAFVDDVLEFANLGAFPATGETGKIYVALDTNKTFRWSGSAYIEISPSPGSTDAVPEGATNQYFTAQRVRDTVLTGLSVATSTAIAAADTVLSAFGKLQAQITSISNFLAGADPFPQYTNSTEAAAAAPVQSVAAGTGISVNTTTGNVVVTNAGVTSISVNGGAPQTGPVSLASGANATTNTARSASFSTAVTTVGTFPITGGSIAAGAHYTFHAVVLVTNTTAASNLVATVAVGATAVATLTQALGTTARTAQTILVFGNIHFQSATTADGYVEASTSSATAFNALAGTGAAPATVATAANTDVNLKLNTSAATSTLIVKSIAIEKVK